MLDNLKGGKRSFNVSSVLMRFYSVMLLHVASTFVREINLYLLLKKRKKKWTGCCGLKVSCLYFTGCQRSGSQTTGLTSAMWASMTGRPGRRWSWLQGMFFLPLCVSNRFRSATSSSEQSVYILEQDPGLEHEVHAEEPLKVSQVKDGEKYWACVCGEDLQTAGSWWLRTFKDWRNFSAKRKIEIWRIKVIMCNKNKLILK